MEYGKEYGKKIEHRTRNVGKCKDCEHSREPVVSERLNGLHMCKGIDAHEADYSCNKFTRRVL